MFENAKIIAFFTLISRIFGYIRDLLIANYFGTTIYSDMFFIVFRMPNSLRRFLGEGAINSSVIPVLSRIDDKDKPKAIWNIIIIFSFLLLSISVLGVIFSKVLISLFAAGFLHSDMLSLLNNMTKITFPYIFFIGLTVLLMGILNTFNRFAVPAFTPVLLNISIIVSILFLSFKLQYPIYALCIGVIIGGILQTAISFVDFFRLRIPFVFTFRIEPYTKEILKLMLITAVGGGVFQISYMVETFLASFMPPGSFSYLFYANRLFQLPFAIFIIAITQSSIVDLSKKKPNELLSLSVIITRFVTSISIFVTLYFLFFGKDLISILFKHGKFNDLSLNNTYYALSIIILGFFFFAQSKVLSNIFYAKKDVKTPLKASSIAAFVSIISSFIFGFLLGFKGLALAMSVSGFFNMIILVWYVNKKIGALNLKTFFGYRCVLLFLVLSALSFIIKSLNFNSYIDVFIASVIYATLFYLYYKYFENLHKR